MLLYGHVCEVHELVVHLSNFRAVLDVAEASKPKLRHVNLPTASVALLEASSDRQHVCPQQEHFASLTPHLQLGACDRARAMQASSRDVVLTSPEAACS